MSAIEGHPDPQPLTDDELATIKARADAASGGGKWNNRDLPHVVDMCESRDVYAVVHRDVGEDVRLPRVIAAHIAGMDPSTTLRLVAEVESLREDRRRLIEALIEAEEDGAMVLNAKQRRALLSRVLDRT